MAVCEDPTSTKYNFIPICRIVRTYKTHMFKMEPQTLHIKIHGTIKNIDDLFQLNTDINWKEFGVKLLADLHSE